MGLIIAVLVLPFVFAVLAAYAVLKLAALLLRVVFAPAVWLSNRPTRQRIELRHYYDER